MALRAMPFFSWSGTLTLPSGSQPPLRVAYGSEGTTITSPLLIGTLEGLL
jgi:hypothetical protein